MIRNIVIFTLLSIAYYFYVIHIFFVIPPAWNVAVNFLCVPIATGAIVFALFAGDTWVRVVLTSAVPIAPMAFAGSFVDTGGINIAYIGPLMAAFAIGAGILHFLTPRVKLNEKK